MLSIFKRLTEAEEAAVALHSAKQLREQFMRRQEHAAAMVAMLDRRVARLRAAQREVAHE